MSSSDFLGFDPSKAEGPELLQQEGQTFETASLQEEQDEIENLRHRNSEILDGLAVQMGFVQTEAMLEVRASAIEAHRNHNETVFVELLQRWHHLAREEVDSDERTSGLDLEKAGIGYILARAAVWQEIGDAANFWEEMATAVAAVQNLPDVHLPLQGHIERMSYGWQIPPAKQLLDAASDYISQEEADQLAEWLDDEVLTVVLVRLLQSGVRDIKTFLSSCGLLAE